MYVIIETERFVCRGRKRGALTDQQVKQDVSNVNSCRIIDSRYRIEISIITVRIPESRGALGLIVLLLPAL